MLGGPLDLISGECLVCVMTGACTAVWDQVLTGSHGVSEIPQSFPQVCPNDSRTSHQAPPLSKALSFLTLPH